MDKIGIFNYRNFQTPQVQKFVEKRQFLSITCGVLSLGYGQ